MSTNGTPQSKANGVTPSAELPAMRKAQASSVSSASPFLSPFAVSATYAAQKAGQDPNDVPTPKEPDFVPDLNVRLICPSCRIDPPDLIEEFSSGDLVCGRCGLVLGDKIVDTRSEWRTFANEDGDDPSRVGQASNPLLDGLTEQLDTRISGKDGHTGVARSLQRTLGRVGGNANKYVLDAFDDIQRKCEQIHLPRATAETAKQLFRQCTVDGICKGRKVEAIVAAAIFVACKSSGHPRTFLEIVALTKVEKKVIAHCYKEMSAAFGLGSNGGGEASKVSVSATSALDLVARFCNHLGLEMSVIRATEDITNIIGQKGVLDGKSPITVAAACIHLSTTLHGLDMGAKKIGAVAAVSDVTIKNSFKQLLERKDDVLTAGLLSKYPRLDPARLPSA